MSCHVQIAQAETELAQLLVDHLPDAGAFLHEDERLGFQLLEGHALAGAPVPGGDREDDLVPVERLERDAAMAAGGPDHAELARAARPARPPCACPTPSARRYQWVELLELPEDDGEDASAGPGGRADLEPALELALGFLVEAPEQLLLEREQPLSSAVRRSPVSVGSTRRPER